MKLTSTDINRIVTKLKSQTHIRFFINHGGGFGDQVSAMHTIARLRQLGVTATIDVIYDDLAAENIANLLGYGASFSAMAPVHDTERKLVLISTSHFLKSYQTSPWLELGFKAAMGGNSPTNLAVLIKVNRLVQTNPYLDTDEETNKLMWGKASVDYSFPATLNNASILYPVTTPNEALAFMRSPEAKALQAMKPGLPYLFDLVRRRYTVSLYGMNVIFKVNPVQVVSNFVQATLELGKPSMLLILNKLTGSELQQLEKLAQHASDHAKYLDVRNATQIKASYSDKQTILIINVGPIPYQVFDALMAVSNLCLQEGANSKSLALNAKKPTIHCRPSSSREGWGYMLPLARIFNLRVSDQLAQIEKSVCGDENNSASAVTILRNYIADLQNHQSLLSQFFDYLFQFYNNEARDRLLLMLNHTFATDWADAYPAAVGEDYKQYIRAIDHGDTKTLDALGKRFNPLLAPDMFRYPPATYAVSKWRMDLAVRLYRPYINDKHQTLPLPPTYIRHILAICTSPVRVYHPDKFLPYVQTLAYACFDDLFNTAGPIVQAVITGNTSYLNTALSARPSDAQSYYNDHSMMSLALLFNQVDSVRTLTTYGATVGAADLHIGAASMSSGTFKLALQYLADKQGTGIQLNTLVEFALENGNENLARHLARLPLAPTDKQAAFKGSVRQSIAAGFQVSTIKIFMKFDQPACDEEFKEALVYYFSQDLYALFAECRIDFTSATNNEDLLDRIGKMKPYMQFLMDEGQQVFDDFLPLVTTEICDDFVESDLCGELLPMLYYSYPVTRLTPLASQCGLSAYEMFTRCNQHASIDTDILRKLKSQHQYDEFIVGSLQSIGFGFIFSFLTTCVDSITNSQIMTRLFKLLMLVVMFFNLSSILEKSFLLMSFPLSVSGAGDVTFGMLHILMNMILAIDNDDLELNDLGTVAVSSAIQFTLASGARFAGRKAGSLVMGMFSSQSFAETEEEAKITKKMN